MAKREALIVAGGLLAMLSACDKKATGQSVAVVNGEEVSVGELNAELQAANLPPNTDTKAIKTQLLQNIINRRLLAQQARKDGIDKSPDYLSRERRMTEQLLIAMDAERTAGSQKLPDQAAIDAYIAAHPEDFAKREMLTLQQVVIDPPSDPRKLAPLKDAHSLDAVAATLTKLGINFQRSQGKLDTASVPAEALKRIESLPPTEPFVLPANGKLFANVIVGREPVNISTEDQRKLALQVMRRETQTKALEAEVKQLRSSAKIEYQPGYAPAAGGNAPGGAAKGK